MTRIVALACVWGLLSGCATQRDRHYRGRYYWGHEVNVFEPCGSEQTYWVRASTGVLSSLKQYVAGRTTEPYQPVYVEFMGHMLDEKADGFAADYDGLIRISEITAKNIDIPAGCKSNRH